MRVLYGVNASPFVRKVRVVLAEKGLEYQHETVFPGPQLPADFRAMSPLSQIPMLELDDGRCLTESRAICTYLESVHPEPNLMGVDGFERAEIEMWDRRVELMVSMPMMLWVRHGNPVLAAVEKNQNPAIAASNEETAMKMVRWFDAQLAERPFMAGSPA